MVRRLILLSLLSFALLTVGAPADGWLSGSGSIFGENVAYANGKVAKVEATPRAGDQGKTSKGSRFRNFKRKALSAIGNTRPVKALRDARKSLQRNAKAFAEVRRTEGLGRALGRSARKIAVETWSRVTPGGRRARKTRRVVEARQHAERAFEAFDAAERQLASAASDQQASLERMQQIYDGLNLDRRSEALSAQERADIESAFGTFKRTPLPSGRLSDKAVHTKGRKTGQEQTQTQRKQLRAMLQSRIKSQRAAVESAQKKVELGATKQRINLRRAKLRLSAERARADGSVTSITDADVDGHMLHLLADSKPPRNNKIRSAVQDQIDIIDAFANAEDPVKAKFLLDEIDAIAAGPDARGDGAVEIFEAYGLDSGSVQGGLSKAERKAVDRLRGRLIKKSAKLLEQQRDNGIDDTGTAAALAGMRGQLKWHNVRLKGKIGSALRTHQRTLKARASAHLESARADWAGAKRKAQMQMREIDANRKRQGEKKLTRGERTKLMDELTAENRNDALTSAAKAQELIEELVELEKPADPTKRGEVTREDVLLKNRELQKLQNEADRMFNRMDPLLQQVEEQRRQQEAEARQAQQAGAE